MLRIILQHFGRKHCTLAVLFVLLSAMVVRSVVPAGYMPAADAGQHGNPLYVFCVPDTGTQAPDALAAFWADIDTDTQTPGAMAESCVFCVLGHFAMAFPGAEGLVVVAVSFLSRPLVAADNPALPVQGPRGPPLGSRAPPFFIA